MKNLNPGFYLRVLLIAFIFASGQGLNGQSYLKKMDNGLTMAVSSSCEDSLGNFYAVIHNFNDIFCKDTLFIKKWDKSGRTWSPVTKLGGYFNAGANSVSCHFLYGKLYVTGLNNATGEVDLMEYTGSWKKISSFQYQSYFKSISSIKFKNRLYFAGGFYKVGGVLMPTMAVFDGSVMSSAGYPSTYYAGTDFASGFAISSDSLFMTCRDKILLHKSPNTWSLYYKSSHPAYIFYDIAMKNNLIYASIYKTVQRIFIINNGTLIDSLDGPFNSRMRLKTFKNELFITTTGYNSSSKVLYIKNRKDIKSIFNNDPGDTADVSFFVSGNNLYYYGSEGVVVKGVDYNHIAEVIVDSLKPLDFDTIRGFVFWDKNNDYKKNGNDVGPKYASVRNLTDNNTIQMQNNTGVFQDIIVNDHDAEYKVDFTQFDSCVQFTFPGNLKSKNTNAGVTMDSLFFPMVRPTLNNKNLVLLNQSWNRARLMDTIPLLINIYNKDCSYSNTTNGTVTVTLDSNTVLVSCTPAYTSKSGNVYTFSNLTFDYYITNLIQLNVLYPNTKYSIGNVVRHFAKLSNITGEDTMDNMDSIVQKMVYSYDPNSKHSLPEGKILKDPKKIRYYINFQNLGNDYAERVTVVDSLNLKMPVYEFRMVGSSHPYSVSVRPGSNTITWVFDNINLKPKNQDEAKSKGYIIFDVKLRDKLLVGDSLRNKAHIYFDYNSPIITNYAVVNLVDKINAIPKVVVRGSTMKLYPNPAQSDITIENITGAAQELKVYDMKGVLVTAFSVGAGSLKELDVDAWASGMYIISNNRGEHLQFIVE